MAFDLNTYSPDYLRNYWQQQLNQYGGNEQQAAQSVYGTAQGLGATYDDLAKFANIITPGSTDWLNRSILQYAVQNPTGYGSNLAQQGNLVGIFNQQPQQPQTYPAQPQQPMTYPNTQQTGLSSLYGQGTSGGSTPRTPKVQQPQQSGVTYTSGSTVNPTATQYPTRQWDLNNFRGSTYFSPQQNNYVGGGGLDQGY